ncbi:MAG: GNAT family N-acetyltransferase [Pseudomonadales bacterium]
MEIQRLDDKHWRRLRRLRLAALADAPDAFGSTLEQAERCDEADWRAQLVDLTTFAAVLDDDDVGMARGAPDDSRTGDAWLLSMWVAPRARQRGIGAALVRAVVDWASAAGHRRLLLDVADGNDAAIALYARCGFVATGITGSLPAPRAHIGEHQRALDLGVR